MNELLPDTHLFLSEPCPCCGESLGPGSATACHAVPNSPTNSPEERELEWHGEQLIFQGLAGDVITLLGTSPHSTSSPDQLPLPGSVAVPSCGSFGPPSCGGQVGMVGEPPVANVSPATGTAKGTTGMPVLVTGSPEVIVLLLSFRCHSGHLHRGCN